ncbi:hypothetical protein GN956_G8140 [Arapaima gigas]
MCGVSSVAVSHSLIYRVTERGSLRICGERRRAPRPSSRRLRCDVQGGENGRVSAVGRGGHASRELRLCTVGL